MEVAAYNRFIQAEEIEAFERLSRIELSYTVPLAYFQNKSAGVLREYALTYIQNIYKCENFDAFVPYLAMNYFDRFLSKREVPAIISIKQENFDLFLICCLTIAWKMRMKSFQLSSYMSERDLKFTPANVMKMELSILNSLEWRMRSLTPICFAEYFTKLLPLPQNFKRRPVRQIIIQTQADIGFTKFRPSVVGASAVLCALSRLFPREYNDFRAAMCRLLSGREAELPKCMAAIDTAFEAKLRALSASEPPKPTTGELSSSLPAGATTGASSSPRQIGGGETPTGSRRTREISKSVLVAAVPPGASIKDITGEPAGDVKERISRRSGKEPVVDVEDIIVEIDKVRELTESGYDALMDFELEWTTDPTAPKLELSSIGDFRGFGIIHALANCCPTPVNELVNRCPIL